MFERQPTLCTVQDIYLSDISAFTEIGMWILKYFVWTYPALLFLYLQKPISIENFYHQYLLFRFSETKPTSFDIKCPFHWRHLNWNVVPTETNETPLRNISANGNKYIEFRRCQIHLSFAITHWHKFKAEYIGFRSWQHNKIKSV